MTQWERLLHKCAQREAAWYKFAIRIEGRGYHKRRWKREREMYADSLRCRMKAALAAHGAGITPEQWSPEYKRLCRHYGAYSRVISSDATRPADLGRA